MSKAKDKPPEAPKTGVDQIELRSAQRRLESAAKVLSKATKEADAAAMQLQLSAVGDVPEFEDGLLLPSEQIRKKYTAEQAEKLEWRRDGALLMLAYKIPKEHIAQALHMNLRTLDALVVQHAARYAGFTELCAKNWMNHAAAAFELAMTKMDEASFLQLATGAGIMVDKAMAVKMVAEGTGGPAVDVEAENGKLTALRERIKQLKPAGQESQPQMVTDQHK